MSNRKLRRGVVFATQETYNKYQCPIIEWIMKHFNMNELQACLFYAQSGLAKAFEDKHKPHNTNNEIVVSEMKQEIN
jgi:hypothetical protein